MYTVPTTESRVPGVSVNVHQKITNQENRHYSIVIPRVSRTVHSTYTSIPVVLVQYCCQNTHRPAI